MLVSGAGIGPSVWVGFAGAKSTTGRKGKGRADSRGGSPGGARSTLSTREAGARIEGRLQGGPSGS